MPPYPNWFRGRDAIIVGTGRPDLRHVPVHANAQHAVAWYVPEPGATTYRAASIELLTLDGDRIGTITAFASPELFARFGWPERASSRIRMRPWRRREHQKPVSAPPCRRP